MTSALDKLKSRAGKVPTAPDSVEREIPLNKIQFDPTQPRKSYHPLDGQMPKSAQEMIDEMAESIESQGLIESITVQELPDGNYLLVVGETRTRAHLKLGRATIRAKVRNDLTDPGKLLIFRLSENVNRNDLTEDELAVNIRVLIKGNDSIKPMTQAQVAKLLSKSEGWISKYVKFGEEENQRLWVQSGIADTVEKVYRLSILPMPIQVEVQRRAALPPEDPEHLEKPLNRSVIDELSREAKRAAFKPTTPPAVAPQTPAGAIQAPVVPSSVQQSGESNVGSNGVAANDTVGQAFASAAADGQTNNSGSSVGATGATEKYTLDPAARAALLGRAASLPLTPKGSRTNGAEREEAQAPVNCRVSVAALGVLLNALAKNEELLTATQRVQCELLIPGSIASLLANELTGVVVDAREVPATLHSALAKLQQA